MIHKQRVKGNAACFANFSWEENRMEAKRSRISLIKTSLNRHHHHHQQMTRMNGTIFEQTRQQISTRYSVVSYHFFHPQLEQE